MFPPTQQPTRIGREAGMGRCGAIAGPTGGAGDQLLGAILSAAPTQVAGTVRGPVTSVPVILGVWAPAAALNGAESLHPGNAYLPSWVTRFWHRIQAIQATTTLANHRSSAIHGFPFEGKVERGGF